MFIFDTDIYTNVMKKIPSKKLVDRLKKSARKRSIYHSDYYRRGFLWHNEILKYVEIT